MKNYTRLSKSSVKMSFKYSKKKSGGGKGIYKSKSSLATHLHTGKRK